jgi:hypothetical protein
MRKITWENAIIVTFYQSSILSTGIITYDMKCIAWESCACVVSHCNFSFFFPSFYHSVRFGRKYSAQCALRKCAVMLHLLKDGVPTWQFVIFLNGRFSLIAHFFTWTFSYQSRCVFCIVEFVWAKYLCLLNFVCWSPNLNVTVLGGGHL